MKRLTSLMSLCLLAASTLASSLAAQTSPPNPQIAWSPKRLPFRPYDAPNKPIWRLAEVLAMHKGQKDWTQPIVRNKDLAGDWHQMAAGGQTPRLEYPDNRTAIIVWEGKLRVSIRGQDPFVASKGFEIDVPFRLPFTLESLGPEPALWFEVHAAGDVPIYPVDTTPEKPKDVAGFVYEKAVLMGGDGTYDERNKPYLDYFKDVVQGGARATAFISSDHMFVNNIRGRGTPTPPPSNKGHFHFGFDESWFIMEGNIDYLIEGVPFFIAAPGDIVTAAQGRWHRASAGGPVGQMDTRVAINPYPYALHNYAPESGGRQ